jgi:hypothetical protein
MTGFAWAHLTDLNMTDFRHRVLHSKLLFDIKEMILSSQEGKTNAKMKTKSIEIFESSSYSTRFPLENLRRRNVVLRDIFVNHLQFEELDQYQLTAGKLDSHDALHYAGVPRVMSVLISLNLMCKSPETIGKE